MIAISRRLAKQLRAVVRRAILNRPNQASPIIVLQTAQAGLCIQVSDPELSFEYREAGSLADERILLPATALDDFQGTNDSLVDLQMTPARGSIARWDDSGVPLVADYVVAEPEKLPPFPATPETLVPVEPGFLRALHDASMTAAKENPRYAITRLQLRGAVGEIIATDGRQLLVQRGFSFPWQDDVLITATGLFGGREVNWDAPVTMGRTDSHIVLRAGRWTIYLAIDAAGRYPDVHSIIPSPNRTCTTWKLKAEDGAFLAKALPRMPGGAGGDSPITVDLNGHAAVRAKAEGQGHPTEVFLNQSEIVGPPVRFCINRKYLARAVELGFTEMQVINPDQPIVCLDDRRVYLWMPLPKEGALTPTEDSMRVASDPNLPEASNTLSERTTVTMNVPSTNGTSPQLEPAVEKNDGSPLRQPGINGLIDEAEALKVAIREDFERASRLAAGLKRHRKQSKVMAATLASLRQLQNIAE